MVVHMVKPFLVTLSHIRGRHHLLVTLSPVPAAGADGLPAFAKSAPRSLTQRTRLAHNGFEIEGLPHHTLSRVATRCTLH